MSQATWKSSDDSWPTHPRPLAEQALKRARQAGWHLKKSSGKSHVWGVVTCGDPDLPREQRCTVSVMSTSGPADGSETARVVDDMVRKCPHDHADPSRNLRKNAQDLAVSASDCLQAAQSLHEARQHRDLVEDYLRRALENADAADQLVEQAEYEESAAVQANTAAEEAAADAGVSISTGAKHLAVVADARATTAKRLLAEESDREARILRARCSEIRQQAQLLLDQL